jgi:hypothetical protein
MLTTRISGDAECMVFLPYTLYSDVYIGVVGFTSDLDAALGLLRALVPWSLSQVCDKPVMLQTSSD